MSSHDKFKAYWESIGKPRLEFARHGDTTYWETVEGFETPPDCDLFDYRIDGDRHWELRRKWIDSDFKLKIECANHDGWEPLHEDEQPSFNQHCEYREAPGR